VGSLQWVSRQALGAHQRALGGLNRRDRVERDHWPGMEPARRNGKVATLTVGLGHDVSTVLGIGRQLGSQPRARISITIMRAPQRGHGQGSTPRASGVISGCCCGSAGGTIWSSVRAVASYAITYLQLIYRRTAIADYNLNSSRHNFHPFQERAKSSPAMLSQFVGDNARFMKQ
jgi:hypothetical protein